MINILVGKFVLEANENVPKPCDLENVELKLMVKVKIQN